MTGRDVLPVLLSPLNAIVDVDVAARFSWSPFELLHAYLDGGATFLQIRAKSLGSGALLELCDAAVTLAQRYDATIVVNDRVDVAWLSGAAGVHVGQDDLPAVEARRLLGESGVIGLSTHSIEQAAVALREPVSYIAVGPVFGTATKDTGYAAVGLDLIRAVVEQARSTPVVAIGGITLDTAESVVAAGAASVAVIGDLVATANPTARVAAYLRALTRHRV